MDKTYEYGFVSKLQPASIITCLVDEGVPVILELSQILRQLQCSILCAIGDDWVWLKGVANKCINR